MPGLETSVAAALRAYGASGRRVERDVERLALAVHCTLLCSGFVPVDLGPGDTSHSPPQSEEPSLPWREGSECFAFRYAHEPKLQVLLKCVAVGSNERPALSCTAALLQGGAGAHTVDLVASDYVSGGSKTQGADLADGVDVKRLGERVEATLVKPLLRRAGVSGEERSAAQRGGHSALSFEGSEGPPRYSEPDPFGRVLPPELGVGGRRLEAWGWIHGWAGRKGRRRGDGRGARPPDVWAGLG